MFQLTSLVTRSTSTTTAPAETSPTMFYIALAFITAILTIFSFVVYYHLSAARKAVRISTAVGATKSPIPSYGSTSTLVDIEKGFPSPVMIKIPEPAASIGQSRIRTSLNTKQDTLNSEQINSSGVSGPLNRSRPPRLARPLSSGQTVQSQPSDTGFETTSSTSSSSESLTPHNIPLSDMPLFTPPAPLERHSTTNGLKPLLLVNKVNRRSLELTSCPRGTRDHSGDLSRQVAVLQQQMDPSQPREEQQLPKTEPEYRTEYTAIPIRAGFARRRLDLSKQRRSATSRIDLPDLDANTQQLKPTSSAPTKRARTSTMVGPMTPPPTPALSRLDFSLMLPTLSAHSNTSKGKGREEPVTFDESPPLSPPLTPVFSTRKSYKEQPVCYNCPELLTICSPGTSASSTMSHYPTIEAEAMFRGGRTADFAKDFRGAGHSDDEVVKDVVARHSESEVSSNDEEEDPLYWEKRYAMASSGSPADRQRHQIHY